MANRHDEAIDAVAARGPVIAVLQCDSAAQALSVGKALREGGLRTVEIMLRTPAAMAALEAVARLGDDLVVGAGTLLQPSQFGDVAQAGARFAVSPGFSMSLADAAERHAMPFLPGVFTPSEILAARAAGFTRLKFFPSEAAGGAKALEAIAGPFADIRFCPTGGIRAENAPAYLALRNVMCVGGSWMAPRDLVAAGDWKGLTALARAAAALPHPA